MEGSVGPRPEMGKVSNEPALATLGPLGGRFGQVRPLSYQALQAGDCGGLGSAALRLRM